MTVEMADKATDLTLKYQYDYRFGTLHFEMGRQGEAPQYNYHIRIADILRHIPAFEMRQFLDHAAENIPPGNIEAWRVKAIEDANLEGKTVLDVGGYMGEYAKRCLDRGAARAIVLDTEQWRHYGPEGWKDETGPARERGVEFVKGDLMDYHTFRHMPDVIGDRNSDTIQGLPRPDVLLLYNILYHVRNPLAFLERAREIVKPGGTMLLCTLFRYHDGAWVYYYDPRECNPADTSVFFGPSLEALERWLRDTGWEYERLGFAFDRVVYTCRATGEVAYRESPTA